MNDTISSIKPIQGEYPKSVKTVRPYKDFHFIFKNKTKEQISSLFTTQKSDEFVKPTVKTHKIAPNFNNLNFGILTENSKQLLNPNLKGIRYGITAFSCILIFTTIFTLTIGSKRSEGESLTGYSIFASKPPVSSQISYKIDSDDSRALTLDKIFKAYKCPFAGMGRVFVEEADKNDIPFWIVPAISFQESICGKITPKVEGEETYNAYGWGVWGENTKTFDNWEQGIEVVSAYIGKKFYSQGITEPCEIMKTYTPPSTGSWCRGVNYFKDIILNYQS